MFKQDHDVFNLLFGAIYEGIIVVDEHQNIVATNPAVEKMFGYAHDELIHKTISNLIPKKYHVNHNDFFNEFIKTAKTRKMGQERDIYGLHKKGHDFPVEIALNIFEVYGKIYVMVMIVDITVRKQQEQKILELNANLEKKIATRSKKLKNTVKQLKETNTALIDENKKRIEAEKQLKNALKKEKELNELKTKFLSLVSHEFKTPLSGILTSTMLLSKYKLANQQDKRDKHLQIITSKVHFLDNILDEFLSVEKLDTGKINYKFKTFKLSKVVNEVIYNFNMLLKEGQRINYPENIDDILVHQDEKTLELMLSNLVHNAIKYSPENSIIDIIINQTKDNLICSIIDNGMGIPIDDQNRIFERYFRAENALHTQGTGIGLNIVKSHLENLGGTINFKSKEQKGSTFTISIPNKGK